MVRNVITDISKTIAITTILGALIVSTFVLNKENKMLNGSVYNPCLTVTMGESRQIGKVIDIERAHEICKELQNWLSLTCPLLRWYFASQEGKCPR